MSLPEIKLKESRSESIARLNEQLSALAESHSILSTGLATAHGISVSSFYKYVKAHNYRKIGHGFYALPDTLVDPSYLLHLRCPGGVFSHGEALYYHELLDTEPVRQTITIYTGYNTKRLMDSDVKVYTVKKELLKVGKIYVKDFYGELIPIYNLERTVCDLIRSRSSFTEQDFKSALRAYTERPDKNVWLLLDYARLFRIDNVLRRYLEIR